MTKDKGVCSVAGCGKKVRAKGKCIGHYTNELRESKRQAEGAPAKPVPSGDDDLISSIVGGQPIKSPPDVRKDNETTAQTQGEKKPPGLFPPSLWLMVGSLLNKVFKTKAYALDKESAEYLSETFAACMAEQNVKVSPTYAFIAALAMWLGMGTVQLLIERASLKQDKTPEKGGEGVWSNLFSMRRAPTDKKEIECFAEESRMSQVIREVPEETVSGNPEAFTPNQTTALATATKAAPPDLVEVATRPGPKYVDLEKMAENSQKEMERVAEVLKKRTG